MSDQPVHPALAQAEQARALEALNARIADLELQAEHRPALRKAVDGLKAIDARLMSSNVRDGSSSPSRQLRPGVTSRAEPNL